MSAAQKQIAYIMYAARVQDFCKGYKHMKKCMQFVCNCLHAACMLYTVFSPRFFEGVIVGGWGRH